MTKLRKWYDSKPEDGRYINLYPSGKDYSVFALVARTGFFNNVKDLRDGTTINPGPSDKWCYAHEPPDWQKNRDEIEAINNDSRIENYTKCLERCRADKVVLDARLEKYKS